MNDLENLYNKRFQDKELPNDDFDADGLWDSVTNELDQNASTGGSKFQPYWPFGILLLLVLVIGLGIYTFSNSDPADISMTSSQADPVAFAKSNSGTNLNASTNLDIPTSVEGQGTAERERTDSDDISKSSLNPTGIQNKNGEIEGNISENIKARSTTSSTVTSTRFVDSSSSLNLDSTQKTLTANNSLNSGEKKTIVKNENINVVVDPIDLSNTDDQKMGNLLESATGRLANKLEVKQNESEEINPTINESEEANLKAKKNANSNKSNVEKEIALVDLGDNENSNNIITNSQNSLNLESDDFLFSEKENLKWKGAVVKVTSIKPLRKKVLDWEVDLYGGVNKLQANFKFDKDSILGTASEKGSYGSSYGLKVGLIWKKNWSLRTGFEYQELWSEFHSETTTIEPFLMDSVLSKVYIDPVSGSTVNRIYEDAFADSTTIHTIVHHNKYTLYSIPLELGWQSSTKRWVYGLSAGVSLNFVSQQTGRRLDRESIVTNFETDDDLVAFKNFGVGIRVTPMLGYRITSRLTAKILPQWETLGIGESDRADRVTKFGVNVGIGFQF